MNYKAIIFDLDGTLLDTISDITDSFNAVLEKANYHTFREEDYKYFAGKGIDVLITSVIDKGELDPSFFNQLKLGYIEEYALRQNNKTKIFDGLMEVLVSLRKKGVSLNILSNKPHFQTVKVVNHYFPNFEFDQVYGKKPEFEIKPNPESAFDLIKNLNLHPKDILYIGDTNVDIQTAVNAKFKSVGVLWGFRPKEELVKAGADYIVSKPNDIYRIMVGDDSDFKSS